MTTARLFTTITVLLAVIMGLTACGDDEPAEGPSPSLTVIARDFSFEPDGYVIPAGAEVPITLDNQGEQAHTWVILSSEISSEEEYSPDLAIYSIEAPPGASESGTIPPLDPGTYQVICNLQGHLTSGMVAELEVVE